MSDQRVDQATDTVRRSDGYQWLVKVGLVSYGVVHLILAWIALQVAFSRGGNASEQGALQQLAKNPLGVALLWVVAVGLVTLCLWQVIEAAVGRSGRSGHQLRRRLTSAGRAVVYLALGISAARIALGGGGSGQAEETLSARLMSVPFGRVLVGAVGLAVLAVGIDQIVKGVKRKFTDDLRGGTSQTTLRLGTVGYCAKGVSVGIIGLLFCYAAITFDASKAGGMDAALSALRGQPFGVVLLSVVALGIAAFGVYCFLWARQAKY
jgi:hypothetical protein